MDVLAAVTEYELAYEADTMTDLGNLTGEFYPTEIAAQYIARMDHDPTITYFRNDSDFGRIYTALRPIFNGKANPSRCSAAIYRSTKSSELRRNTS